MYKLTNENTIIRISDNAFIPMDERNTDYVDYLKWAETNTPTPADPEPEPTVQELREEEYNKRGATIDALTVALWEKVVEGRSSTADGLQVIRESVKEEYPK